MKELKLIGPTSQEYENIYKELGENKARFELNLKLLKEWMKFQTHLPQDYDPEILPIFLRGCKHDLDKTKRKLDNYFSARASVTEILQDRDPLSKEIIGAAKAFQMATLPRLTPLAYRVTFHKFTNVDSSLFNPRDVFKLILMIADLRMLEESPIAGDIFVFDVKHMTAGHCARVAQPALLSKMLTTVQHAYPQRLAQIHLINASPPVYKLINLFKNFMKEKMRSRFFLYRDTVELENLLPKECKPKDYGGSLATLEELHEAWQRKLAANRNWFAKQEKVRADNSRRADENNNKLFKTESIFGTEGAFRKLEID